MITTSQTNARTTLPGFVYLGNKPHPHWEVQFCPPKSYRFATSSTRGMGHVARIDSANLPTSVHCARVPTCVRLVIKGPMRVPMDWQEVEVTSDVGWSKGLLSHFRSIWPTCIICKHLLQWSAKLGQPLVEPAALKPRVSCNAEWYDTGHHLLVYSYLHSPHINPFRAGGTARDHKPRLVIPGL